MAVTKEEPTDASSDSPTVYTATQIPTVNSLPDPVADRADLRRELSWGFGPVNVRIVSQNEQSAGRRGLSVAAA